MECGKCEARNHAKSYSTVRCSSCSVKCAPGFEKVSGGEASHPVCSEETFPCPAKVHWSRADKSCRRLDGVLTNYYCCPEAWPPSRTTAFRLQGSCHVQKTED